MSGRSRHGLHAVRGGDAPAAEPTAPVLTDPGGPYISLHQESVRLAVGGRLDADTAGRLRMFLTMFTVSGGPRELVLDLSEVVAVDEDGMAPIFEADEAMGLRLASLRLDSVSAAVAHFLDDIRCDRTPPTGPPLGAAAPDTAGGPAVPASAPAPAPAPDDRPRRGQD